MRLCPVHAANKLSEAINAFMRSHVKAIIPEIAASLSDRRLLSVLDSDELEID